MEAFVGTCLILWILFRKKLKKKPKIQQWKYNSTDAFYRAEAYVFEVNERLLKKKGGDL